MTLQSAIARQVAWKDAEVQAFAVSLVSHALSILDKAGMDEFTTDIVPDAERGTGTGIAGSVVNLLTQAHVIRPVGVWMGGAFCAKRVLSRRESTNARQLALHTLCSRAAAEEFLRRHGALPTLKQFSFDLPDATDGRPGTAGGSGASSTPASDHTPSAVPKNLGPESGRDGSASRPPNPASRHQLKTS